jgi:carbamoyl-phosphate synthase large subunit
MLKEQRIFVSGGNGVIGNALIERLHKQGAVLFVGDLKPRPDHWPEDIIYRQGDLNFIAKDELESFAPTIFFHLAATFERSNETYEFWEENFHHNVKLSNHLMTLLKDIKSLKKVIFASSYLIYDPQLYTFTQPATKAYRLKEDDIISPRNLTGSAKLNHEIELQFLSEFKQDKFQAISARIYRSYGRNSRDIISRWIRSLLNNETLTVYAKEGMFDYVYADEVAEGLMRLSLTQKINGIVNLGNDNARKVTEILGILRKYFPQMKTVEINSNVKYEASQANMDHFYNMLGWKPQRQLEDTIPEIIEYEKNNRLRVSEPFNILVTSISRKVPLLKSVRKAAQKIMPGVKIYGGDIDSACIGKYFTDDFWLMPQVSKLTEDDLLAYCRQNNIRCIIPTRDGELTFFSRIKTKLAAHNIHVMVSDLNSVALCMDKLAFFDKFHQVGLPVVTTTNQLELLTPCDSFVVKERYGAGSHYMGINLDKAQAIKQAGRLEHPVFQPYIKGKEASIDIYISKTGKIKGMVARKRDTIINGESQITSTFRNEKLEQLCADFVENMSFYGHILLQVIIDETGAFHIIECNSRFGGASTLSLAAGLDSFYWFLLESLGVDIQAYSFLRSKTEKVQIRFPEDIVING